MFVDNTAMRFMANEWKVSDNSKHINTRYHFLRSHAIRGTMILYYVDTKENVADMGTKPLDKSQHWYLFENVMDIGTENLVVQFVERSRFKRSRQVFR